MDRGVADIDGRLKIGHKLVAVRNASVSLFLIFINFTIKSKKTF
jgi:hypothetical protein